MLKLEKIAKSRELSVLLRSKPTILTFPFLCALGYALLIHIAALFLFQISPFKVTYQQSLFAPVRVATEMPIHHGVLSTNLQFEEQEPIAEYLIAPLPLTPTLPKAYQMLAKINRAEMEQNNTFNAHLPLEGFFFDNLETPLAMESQSYQVLAIYLSGPISEYSLKNKDVETLDPQPQLTYRILFSVKVNQSNGEIFWWDLREAPDSKQLQNEAINVLKSLQFAPQSTPDFLSGGIEIVMTPQMSRNMP